MQLKHTSRMMKKVTAVVSKAMLVDVRASSIFSASFCANIFVQPSLNADFLFFMFSRNRRTKGCFRGCSPSEELQGGVSVCIGGSDSRGLISLHKGGKRLWWPEGRLNLDPLLTQLTPPHPKIAKTQRSEDLEQLETDLSPGSSLSDVTEAWNYWSCTCLMAGRPPASLGAVDSCHPLRREVGAFGTVLASF